MAAKKDVDPRFDPRFQRGFDGKVAPTDPAPTTPAPARVAPPPPRQPVPDAAPASSKPTTEPAASPAISATASVDDDPLPRFNPFRLALLLASVGAILLSFWISWLVLDSLVLQFGGGTDPSMQFLAQLTYWVPGALLTGGLIGFVLWLAVGVVAPRRRREDERDDE